MSFGQLMSVDFRKFEKRSDILSPSPRQSYTRREVLHLLRFHVLGRSVDTTTGANPTITVMFLRIKIQLE
jgi:hypothetical protein